MNDPIQSEDIDALISVGLTALEAKVYLTAAALDHATVKAIAKTTKIARQHCYQLLSDLQKKSLVEKVIASPVEFKALPILDGVPILLQRKQQEMSEIERKATQILDRHKHKDRKKKADLENYILFVPDEKAFYRRIKKLILNCKRMDVAHPVERQVQALTFGLSELEETIKKGATVRCIIETPKNRFLSSKIMQLSPKNPLFMTNYTSNTIRTPIAIFDGKTAAVFTSEQTDWNKGAYILSDNPRFAAIIQDYFDFLWQTSRPMRWIWSNRLTGENLVLKGTTEEISAH